MCDLSLLSLRLVFCEISYVSKYLLNFSLSHSHTDNMGLICNQLEGKLNDEVINESIEDVTTSNSFAANSHSANSDTIISSSRRKRKLKQSPLNPQNFLHNLFKWYFKSTSSLHDDEFATSPHSSVYYCNNHDVEHDLVYREHATSLKSPSLVSSTTSLTSDNYQQRRRRASSSRHHPPSPSSNLSLTNSHYYIRQSICLYAASSVILALCYLVTPSTAATDSASHPV